MSELRIKKFDKILSPLIECFGDKDCKATFWNKFQGYGLKASEFEKYEGSSSRKFSRWKNFMLEQKWVRIPRVKRGQKKHGSNRSPYNLPYAITPIGICYFSSILNEIDSHSGKKIIEILSYYYSYELHLDWGKICEVVGEKEAHQILKKICDSIDIDKVNEETHIILSYKSSGKISYELFRYIINQNQVLLELSEGDYSDEPDVNQTPVPTRNIDDDSFFGYVAEFILESFCYHIIENCHLKISKKSRMSEGVELTKKEKLNHKNIISKYQTILENIPLEVHLTAYNFMSQNTFGSIKQEQEMVNKVYNYFNKIASKYETDFEDNDGKSFDLFSQDNLKNQN